MTQAIVVSGGSRGLGAEIVRLCLKRSWSVATFSRSKTPFVEDMLSDAGLSDRFYWQSIDGGDADALKAFAKTAHQEFGRIDGLVNNMGIGQDGLLAMMRQDEVDNCLDVNLRGPIALTQACTRLMLRNASGASVVNISSVNAVRGHSGVAVYSATKAALDGFARSLARELGPKSIRVNTVAPGYFESDMVADLTDAQRDRIARRTPLGRLARVEEIARAVIFLLSPDASFITGQTLTVDGGITC